MFGIADYPSFIVAVIVFLMIPGPGNLALAHVDQQGWRARRPGRDTRRHHRRPGADVALRSRCRRRAGRVAAGLSRRAVARCRLPRLARPAHTARQARRQTGAAHPRRALLPAGPSRSPCSTRRLSSSTWPSFRSSSIRRVMPGWTTFAAMAATIATLTFAYGLIVTLLTQDLGKAHARQPGDRPRHGAPRRRVHDRLRRQAGADTLIGRRRACLRRRCARL